MKKAGIFFLAAVVLFMQFLYAVPEASAAVSDDIEVEFETDDNRIVDDDEFELTLTITNKSGVKLSDIYFVIDSSSAFSRLGGGSRVDVGVLENEATSEEIAIDLAYKGSGRELKLNFSYIKEGDPEPTTGTETLYLNAYGSSGGSPSGGSSTVDTTKYAPRIGVEGGTNIPTVTAGKTAKITFPLKNTGSYTARNITAVLDLGSFNMSPFTFEQINLTRTIEELKAGETGTVTYELKVNPTAASGIFPVELKYTYTNSYKDSFSGSETVYIRIENKSIPPKLSVVSIETGPEEVKAGEDFKLKINVMNDGTLKATDVKVTLGGLKGDGFTVKESSDVRYIQSILGLTYRTAEYSLHAHTAMSAGIYGLPVRIDYKDEMGNTYSEENQVFIEVIGSTAESGGIDIRNINVPSGSIGVGEDFDLSFEIANTGGKEIRNIKVWLDTGSQIIPKSLNPMMFSVLQGNETRGVKFTLCALPETETKNYPIAINVEYELTGGEAVRNSVLRYTGVLVDGSTGKTVPKIIINEYGFEPEEVTAGENFTLNLSFLNTNETMPVKNVKISVAPPATEGIFTPANSSSTFFIEYIGCREAVEKSIVLYPKADAAPKSYLLNVKFEYEDSKGTQYEAEEVISIPVKQEARLVTGDLNIPPEAFMGQPVSLFLEFYNMGKSTLYNLMVKTEGDFSGQDTSFFVGNFEPGRSDYYDAMITPNSPGEVTGNLVFSFEDELGRKHEIKKEFTLNVIEMQPMGGEMFPEGIPGMGPDGKPFPGEGQKGISLFVYIGAGLGAVAVIVVVIILLRKRRIARKDMALDE
jgi:hypothetical protein